VAEELAVVPHDPQLAVGRAMDVRVVGGQHADHPAGPVGERGGLDGAEAGGGGDVVVDGEGGVGGDVGDHDLSPQADRPATGRPAVTHFGEVLEELAAEPVLGDDDQRTGLRIEGLEVAPLSGQQ
jgi:hypothetical protein